MIGTGFAPLSYSSYGWRYALSELCCEGDEPPAKPAIGKNAVAVRLAAVQMFERSAAGKVLAVLMWYRACVKVKLLKCLIKWNSAGGSSYQNMAYVPVLKADVEALKQSLAGIHYRAVEALWNSGSMILNVLLKCWNQVSASIQKQAASWKNSCAAVKMKSDPKINRAVTYFRSRDYRKLYWKLERKQANRVISRNFQSEVMLLLSIEPFPENWAAQKIPGRSKNHY